MHHIEEITVTFSGLGKHQNIYKLPKELGTSLWKFVSEKTDEDFIPAELVIPELNDPIKGPATCLRGMRYREELTQKQLAEKLGIRQHHLSEMENGKRPIGKEMAKKLAKVLRADYKLFL